MNEIKKLIQNICSFYKISPDELINDKSRKREIVEIRQMICYFLRNNIKSERIPNDKLELRIIANIFNQDHTTIIHSLKKMNNLIKYYSNIRNKVKAIENYLISIEKQDYCKQYFYSVEIKNQFSESFVSSD